MMRSFCLRSAKLLGFLGLHVLGQQVGLVLDQREGVNHPRRELCKVVHGCRALPSLPWDVRRAVVGQAEHLPGRAMEGRDETRWALDEDIPALQVETGSGASVSGASSAISAVR